MPASNPPVWRQILRLRSTAPTAFAVLRWLVIIELAAMLVAPLVVPDRIYLWAYLNRDAVNNTAIVADDRHPMLRYDPVVGWRTAPGVAHKSWRTDAHGSRSTHPFDETPRKAKRVLFVGDSMTNGGTAVDNGGTISAYVENDEIESINFATMLYSLDQMLLAYEHRLGRFNANIVVVGLSVPCEVGLTNRYVPLRARQEENMPFFKPRYRMREGELVLIPPPGRDAYGSLFDSDAVLDELASSDTYFQALAEYRRFGLTPLAALGLGAANKIRRVRDRVYGPGDGDEASTLRPALMRAFAAVADKRGAKLLFMLLPNQMSTQPDVIRRQLIDPHIKLLSDMRSEGFDVFDAREPLRNSGLSMRELYSEDRTHYRQKGNEVIAAALQPLL